jgi:hypothetical protein
MKTIPRSLDDVAVTVRGFKINPQKAKYQKTYYQHMQSLYGSRKFVLRTDRLESVLTITLFEGRAAYDSRFIASRTATFNDENSIHRAIKSLERKAKCKLYYVLLISTDGEYL